MVKFFDPKKVPERIRRPPYVPFPHLSFVPGEMITTSLPLRPSRTFLAGTPRPQGYNTHPEPVCPGYSVGSPRATPEDVGPDLSPTVNVSSHFDVI